jgi:hypothetical protein
MIGEFLHEPSKDAAAIGPSVERKVRPRVRVPLLR